VGVRREFESCVSMTCGINVSSTATPPVVRAARHQWPERTWAGFPTRALADAPPSCSAAAEDDRRRSPDGETQADSGHGSSRYRSLAHLWLPLLQVRRPTRDRPRSARAWPRAARSPKAARCLLHGREQRSTESARLQMLRVCICSTSTTRVAITDAVAATKWALRI
jgi:hypothetical protein